MKRHFLLIHTLPALIVIAVIVASCEKKPVDKFSPDRFFTPTSVSVNTHQTSADITWPASLYSGSSDVTYTVEVSKDPQFQSTPDFSTTVDTTAAVVTDDAIQPRQLYYARVKANGAGSAGDSKWMVSDSFKISGKQIFLPIQPGDVIDKGVLLRWQSAPGLTKIVITPDGGSSFDVTLSTADTTAAQKAIKGLTPNTSYSAEIFAGSKSQGYLTFTTVSPIAGDNIIDLRNIDGRPTVLYDTLSQVPSGSLILLDRGAVYDIPSAYTFDRSVTIMSGMGFGAQAILSLQNNFDASGNIDSIKLVDVNIASNGASYFMNVGQVAVINKMSLENVTTTGVFDNSFIRLKKAGDEIKNLYITNSVIDSFGVGSKYPILYANASSSAKIDNIEIRNSTFYYFYWFVRQEGIDGTSLIIDQCTFNDLLNQGGYFIRYNNGAYPSTFRISNCIFGRTDDPANAKGIAGGSPDITNSYRTSDFVLSGNDITGLQTYANSSYDLFADPDKGNFLIVDDNFLGKTSAGDPRWRQ